MFPEIDHTLVTKAQIAKRVTELARDIVADLERDLDKDGHTTLDEGRVTIIPIMTGAMIFAADLIRSMPVKLSLGLTSVKSYPGASVTSKGAHLESELPKNLEGKHVLVIDDILDSGQTMLLVKELIGAQKPASLRTCVLLDKKARRAVDVQADYTGFDIPDEFVVGYGLDFDGYYRNHPEIAVLKPSVLENADS